jgi:hypothetical protein
VSWEGGQEVEQHLVGCALFWLCCPVRFLMLYGVAAWMFMQIWGCCPGFCEVAAGQRLVWACVVAVFGVGSG